MGTMLSNVIAVGSAGFIGSKVFKCLGKPEYAELIMLCGWVGMGIALFTWLNGASIAISNGWVGKTISGLTNLISWLISLAS
jgi:hypothetical protein